MSEQDFTATITVDQTPEEAIVAIKNVRGWWSEQIEGSTVKLGDECSKAWGSYIRIAAERR